LRAALTVADTLLIPVQPRTFDVWSVEQMAERASQDPKAAAEIRRFGRALCDGACPSG
jgi:chromosome partitioning protein